MKNNIEFKALYDFPSYYAGSDGRIYRRALKQTRGKHRYKCLTEFRYPDSKYMTVFLYLDRKKYGILVHRLVAAAYFDVVPVEFDIKHINGNFSDNRPSNLCAEKSVIDPSSEKSVCIPVPSGASGIDVQTGPNIPADIHAEAVCREAYSTKGKHACYDDVTRKYLLKRNSDEGLDVIVARLEIILKRYIKYVYTKQVWKDYLEIRSRGSLRLAYNWLNIQLRSFRLI